MGTIYLVRHAQASFGKRDYDQLSDLGERQSVRLGEALVARGIRPTVVVAGAMRRHAQTAAIALKAAGLTHEVAIDEGFNEFDHDEVIVAYKPAYQNRAVLLADLGRTGHPGRAFQAMFAEATERWTQGGDGYTETFADFCGRAEAAVRRTADRVGKGGTAVVFTSGGPIAAAVSRSWTGGDELWLKLNPVTINTAITKFTVGRSGLTAVGYNDHGHLDGTDLLTYR
jgi:broad specificity phosphatase PhoE